MVFDFNRFVTFFTLFLCNVSLLFMGCDEERVGDVLSQIEHSAEIPNLFSEDEWEIVRHLSPLPDAPPPNPTNRFADDPAAAQLGQMFFFDFQKKAQSLVQQCGYL